MNTKLGPQTLRSVATHLIVHCGSKAEIAWTSCGGRIGLGTPVLSLLCPLLLLLLLLELGLRKKFDLILLSLNCHLHHLHLQVLSLLKVYARGEW